MSNLNTVANSETAHMGWPSELVELRWFSQDYLLPDPRRASGLLPVQRAVIRAALEGVGVAIGRPTVIARGLSENEGAGASIGPARCCWEDRTWTGREEGSIAAPITWNGPSARTRWTPSTNGESEVKAHLPEADLGLPGLSES